MSSSPVPIKTGAPAPGADRLKSIHSKYTTRERVQEALARLTVKRADLNRETVAKWSADVASRGLDPNAAVAARDTWKRAADSLAAQQSAIETLAALLESQIAAHRKSDAADVAAVLRERIAALSALRATREKEGTAIDLELKMLLDELAEVDSSARPGREPAPKEAPSKEAAAKDGPAKEPPPKAMSAKEGGTR